MEPSLTSFFDPHGIVVVGASHDPTKLGYGVARDEQFGPLVMFGSGGVEGEARRWWMCECGYDDSG